MATDLHEKGKARTPMIPRRTRWGWLDLRTHPETSGGAREPCRYAVGPNTFCLLLRALEKLLIMCFIISWGSQEEPGVQGEEPVGDRELWPWLLIFPVN